MSSFLLVSLLNTCMSTLNESDWDSMEQFNVHDKNMLGVKGKYYYLSQIY